MWVNRWYHLCAFGEHPRFQLCLQHFHLKTKAHLRRLMASITVGINPSIFLRSISQLFERKILGFTHTNTRTRPRPPIFCFFFHSKFIALFLISFHIYYIHNSIQKKSKYTEWFRCGIRNIYLSLVPLSFDFSPIFFFLFKMKKKIVQFRKKVAFKLFTKSVPIWDFQFLLAYAFSFSFWPREKTLASTRY